MEPNEPNPSVSATLHARACILHALAGALGIKYLERARELVGIDGIRDIALALARYDDRPHGEAWILGALHSLLGESYPPDGAFIDYGCEETCAEGYDAIVSAGFFGTWDRKGTR